MADQVCANGSAVLTPSSALRQFLCCSNSPRPRSAITPWLGGASSLLVPLGSAERSTVRQHNEVRQVPNVVQRARALDSSRPPLFVQPTLLAAVPRQTPENAAGSFADFFSASRSAPSPNGKQIGACRQALFGCAHHPQILVPFGDCSDIGAACLEYESVVACVLWT